MVEAEDVGRVVDGFELGESPVVVRVAGGDLGQAVDLMIEEANRCYHELGLRGWGKIEWDYVLENTQRFERACQRLATAGLEEAAAPPISDRAPAGRSDAGT